MDPELAAFAAVAAGMLGVRWIGSRRGRRDLEAACPGHDLSNRVVLAVGAHPDDLEFYAGGCLRLLSVSGARVVAVVATDGERGGSLPDLPDVRRREQEAAAAILGLSEVVFLGLPDRRLRRVQEALEAALHAVWERVRPAVVFSFDPVAPQPPYVHPDHQALGRAVLRVAAARSAAGEPPATLYLFHTRRPNAAVDIESVFEAKLRAFRAHASQMTRLEWMVGPVIRRSARANGRRAGFRWAEAFFVCAAGDPAVWRRRKAGRPAGRRLPGLRRPRTRRGAA